MDRLSSRFSDLRDHLLTGILQILAERKTASASLIWCFFCFVAVTAILFWRRPDAFSNPQFWAEDGNTFFVEALYQGSKSITIPYAGYYHLVARLIAFAGSFMPMLYVPALYAWATYLIVIFIAVYIFSSRFSLPNYIRFLLGLSIVCTTAGNEVFINICNLAFLMFLPCLLLCISDEPQSLHESVFDLILLPLVGLSTPFAICLWLLFLLRWIVRRTNHSIYLLVISIIVAVIQVFHMGGRLQTEGPVLLFSPYWADALICRFAFCFLGTWATLINLTNTLRVGGVVIVVGFYACLSLYLIQKKSWGSDGFSSGSSGGMHILLCAVGTASTSCGYYQSRRSTLFYSRPYAGMGITPFPHQAFLFEVVAAVHDSDCFRIFCTLK